MSNYLNYQDLDKRQPGIPCFPIMDCSVKGIDCEYVDVRVRKESVPPHLYVYEVADADSDGIPCRIKEHILVNFMGTIFSKTPLPLVDGALYLDDEDDFYFT